MFWHFCCCVVVASHIQYIHLLVHPALKLGAVFEASGPFSPGIYHKYKKTNKLLQAWLVLTQRNTKYQIEIQIQHCLSLLIEVQRWDILFVMVLHYYLVKHTLNSDVFNFRVQEDHPIMSFTISKNGRLALLNVATQVSL